jgi:hypothetical protein
MSKRVEIKNKRGEVVGHLTLYWCNSLPGWVTIPGADAEGDAK